MATVEFLRVLGVRVVEMDGLEGVSGWVPELRVLVLDSSLTEDELTDVVSQVLPEISLKF